MRRAQVCPLAPDWLASTTLLQEDMSLLRMLLRLMASTDEQVLVAAAAGHGRQWPGTMEPAGLACAPRDGCLGEEAFVGARRKAARRGQ